MTTMKNGRRSGARYATVALLALTPLLAACDLDEMLEAKDPFTVTPGTARDTANLETVYAGARSQFALAFGGLQNNEGGIVVMSGLMSDELYASDNFNTRRAVDSRSIDYRISNAASDHAFRYLQRARVEAINGIELYGGSPRANGPRHAELNSIAGYSLIMLAENFCAGIPLSRISSTGTEFGAPQSAQELYEMAIAHFDAALGMANAGATQLNLARMGKARALVDLGRFAEAGQVASQVPTNFVFSVQYSPGAFETPNPVFNFNHEERRISASRQEGTSNRGLSFGSVNDYRVRISATSVASNAGGDVLTWLQLKYTSQADAIVLASGVEARLIEAEAGLGNGSTASYLTKLNELRTATGLTTLADPGTAATRIDQLFEERAYYLYLTGHRLSDMRRLIRQYGRAQASVFPTGNTAYGTSYGTDVSLPIPFEEVNNPQYTVCTNTGA